MLSAVYSYSPPVGGDKALWCQLTKNRKAFYLYALTVCDITDLTSNIIISVLLTHVWNQAFIHSFIHSKCETILLDTQRLFALLCWFHGTIFLFCFVLEDAWVTPAIVVLSHQRSEKLSTELFPSPSPLLQKIQPPINAALSPLHTRTSCTRRQLILSSNRRDATSSRAAMKSDFSLTDLPRLRLILRDAICL